MEETTQADLRAQRAETLRSLLLSTAQEGTIDDRLLLDAIKIIHLPVDHLSVTGCKLDQLLEDWQAGDLPNAKFVATWHRLSAQGSFRKEEDSGSVLPDGVDQEPREKLVNLLILCLVSGIAAGTVWWAWQAYRDVYTEFYAWLTGKPIVEVIPASAYVSEAINLASLAKIGVAEYHQTSGTFADTNEKAGLAPHTASRARGVGSITISEGGKITIIFNKLVGEGLSLTMTPRDSDNGIIAWTCQNGGLPAHLLPPECQ